MGKQRSAKSLVLRLQSTRRHFAEGNNLQVHTDIADSVSLRACVDTSEIIEIIRPYRECNHDKPEARIKFEVQYGTK